MCYGYDGEGALRRSLAERGMSRRSVLRGAALGTAGVAALGTADVAVAGGRGPQRHRVPPGRISIQLWTLRSILGPPFGEPLYDETLQTIADIGYPRVEQALGYFGRTAAELKAFYDDLGIRATSSHDGISATPADLETKLDNAETLGQRYVVVPYLASDSLSEWQTWAEQMNVEAREAKKRGLRYGYHNHAHEFTTDLGGGVTPWQVLTTELDPRFVHLEVDLYWAVTGGLNQSEDVTHEEAIDFAIDVIEDAPQKVRQYHVKDKKHVEAPDDHADLGTGFIDFAKIFEAHQVEEYIVENDTPDVTPIQTAEVGYSYLRSIRF
ncbi:sugar phosphate isomerase/epimerase family protein [Nocardioides sp. GXQ0305]|uniref:sugar phosphate isomerase/epimerase family protein n=1 Tax=Nocardioides sp. GXQ0305 TaxID=3423912 RepID=UPI003D7EA0B5